MANYCELGVREQVISILRQTCFMKMLYHPQLGMFVPSRRRRQLGAMSVISDKMLGESEQNLGKETQSLTHAARQLSCESMEGSFGP